MPDIGPQKPKHVALTNVIILKCCFVWLHVAVFFNLSQHNGINSNKIL